MTALVLDRVLKAYRIGDPGGRYPIFDAAGAVKFPGRWNTQASPMIYTSMHYSTAMLEKLVHGSGQLPPDQHYVEITIPNGIRYEMFDAAKAPDWFSESAASSKAYGDAWQQSGRSLILIVPSVVARIEENILINPEHPDFPKITTDLPRPVWWDERLFAG